MTFQILVPNNRTVYGVVADGARASRMQRLSYSGFDWSIEEWDAPELAYPPNQILIHFEPQS